MVFNIVISLISIILENIFNLYLNEFEYFTPLFTLISLIIIYPNFKDNKKSYFIFSIILGFIYDIFFTNFYVLNPILFFVISAVIYYIFSKKEYNFKYLIITTIITIFIYNLMLFLILNFFNYTNYSILDFSYILRHFILANIIYVVMLYIIVKNTYFIHKL